MLLNGKKTERVMMRVSEEMAHQIRALAELEHRTVQDQVRFLLTAGLSQAWFRNGNGTMEAERQQMSAAPVVPVLTETKAKSPVATPVSSRQQKRANREVA